MDNRFVYNPVSRLMTPIGDDESPDLWFDSGGQAHITTHDGKDIVFIGSIMGIPSFTSESLPSETIRMESVDTDHESKRVHIYEGGEFTTYRPVSYKELIKNLVSKGLLPDNIQVSHASDAYEAESTKHDNPQHSGGKRFKVSKLLDMIGESDEETDFDWGLTAISYVRKARQGSYGHPVLNFSRIASYWNNYLRGKIIADAFITPVDIAYLMVLTKVAREVASHKDDNSVDIIGYTLTHNAIDTKMRELGYSNGAKVFESMTEDQFNAFLRKLERERI